MEFTLTHYPRTELHLHTAMSELDGINTISEYIDEAIRLGMSSIAVTDHCSVQSFCDGYKTVERYRRMGIDFKLIYGCEINLLGENKQVYHATVLVKEEEGMKNLYSLLSASLTEYYHKKPLIPKSKLELYRKGLLIGSGCEMGELYSGVHNGKTDEELKEIASFYDYIEILPASNFLHFFQKGHEATPYEITQINRSIIKAGENAGKLVVCTGDVHYLHKRDIYARRVLLHYLGYDNYETTIPLHLKTTKEMLCEFGYLGKEKAHKLVVENPNILAMSICKTFPPIDENNIYDVDTDKLSSLAENLFHEKYGDNPLPHFEERLKTELSFINKYKENAYNLMVCARLAQKARNDGQHFGSRGSVASSFLAYILGVTDINPMEAHYYCENCHYTEIHPEYYCGADLEDKMCACGHKLTKDGFTIPFESFFGFDGDKAFDIDLNFAPEYQFNAMDNLKNVTGGELVRAGVVGTIPYKVALKMVKAYEENENISLPEEIKQDLVAKLSRVKKGMGMHPGGMFVIPEGKKTAELTPVQYSSYDIDRKILVTHFDYWKFDMLLKCDILAHNMYSMTMELEKMTNVACCDIPLHDDLTDNLLKSGKTIGLPEFSSYFIKNRVMPLAYDGTFDSLVRISGLSHGTDVFADNGEYLLKSGKKITDIVSCREDVFHYLLEKGLERYDAFAISERIRKGKGVACEQEFMLSQNGVERWRVKSWNKIKYSFPRAHCVAYVKTAYQLAFYKAHFPLEFYCAFLNANSDYVDINMFNKDSFELADSIIKLNKNKETWESSFESEVLKVCLEMSDMGYRFLKGKCQDENKPIFTVKDGVLTTE